MRSSRSSTLSGELTRLTQRPECRPRRRGRASGGGSVAIVVLAKFPVPAVKTGSARRSARRRKSLYGGSVRDLAIGAPGEVRCGGRSRPYGTVRAFVGSRRCFPQRGTDSEAHPSCDRRGHRERVDGDRARGGHASRVPACDRRARVAHAWRGRPRPDGRWLLPDRPRTPSDVCSRASPGHRWRRRGDRRRARALASRPKSSAWLRRRRRGRSRRARRTSVPPRAFPHTTRRSTTRRELTETFVGPLHQLAARRGRAGRRGQWRGRMLTSRALRSDVTRAARRVPKRRPRHCPALRREAFSARR